jgi:hypothetical protein
MLITIQLKTHNVMTKTQKNAKSVETLVLLALGGLFALGPTASAQSTNQLTVRPALVAKSQRGAMGPLEMMKQSLNLSDEQAKKLEPVLKEQQEKLSALRRDTTLSRKDRVAKLKELQQGTDIKIKAQLAPEQAEKWQKMRLGQGQTFQVQGQSSAETNMFSLRPQVEKGQQGLPTWRSRIPQLQAAQPPSAQPAVPK